MSRELWDLLAERTAGFNEPYCLSGPLAEPLCRPEDLTQIIRGLADDDFALASRMLDVTVEGDHRPELKSLVIDDPPKPGEELEGWARRVFDGRRFSVMVNAAERWSEPLVRAAAEFFAPARAAYGIPQQSYRISLFIGDYGFTPSGVHRDIGRDERVVHYNVGPGPKTFHSWPVELYRRLTGGTRPMHRPELILDEATSHTLEPGDVMLLDVSRYHVGQSDELAATVGLEMSKIPAKAVLKEAAATALTGQLSTRPEPVQGTAFEPEPCDYTDLGWVGLPETDVGSWLQDAVAGYIERQRSNLGFTAVPAPLFVVDEDEVREGFVRLARPFPLVFREHADHGELFVRGVRLRVPLGDTPALVQELDSGRELAVADLARRYGRDPDVVVRLLAILLRLRGLDLHHRSEGED